MQFPQVPLKPQFFTILLYLARPSNLSGNIMKKDVDLGQFAKIAHSEQVSEDRHAFSTCIRSIVSAEV